MDRRCTLFSLCLCEEGLEPLTYTLAFFLARKFLPPSPAREEMLLSLYTRPLPLLLTGVLVLASPSDKPSCSLSLCNLTLMTIYFNAWKLYSCTVRVTIESSNLKEGTWAEVCHPRRSRILFLVLFKSPGDD